MVWCGCLSQTLERASDIFGAGSRCSSPGSPRNSTRTIITDGSTCSRWDYVAFAACQAGDEAGATAPLPLQMEMDNHRFPGLGGEHRSAGTPLLAYGSTGWFQRL